jgi:hypothetical protein
VNLEGDTLRYVHLMAAAAITGLIGVQARQAHAATDACQSIGGNLVANCGFETDDFTSWTVTVATTGSAVEVAGSAYSGSYAANFGANGGSDDLISQTLATTAGDYYRVTFYLQGDPGATTDDFNAVWNPGTPYSQSLAAVTDDDTSGYVEYTATVHGVGSDVIQFGGADPSNLYIQLDSISVVQTAAPAPEPASLALFGAGLFGLGLIRRKRRQ